MNSSKIIDYQEKAMAGEKIVPIFKGKGQMVASRRPFLTTILPRYTELLNGIPIKMARFWLIMAHKYATSRFVSEEILVFLSATSGLPEPLSCGQKHFHNLQPI